MDGPHVICEGPEFGEGPVWCPPGAGDRARSCARACRAARSSRVWPSTGRREMIADTGGGANGAVLAPTAASSSPRTAASTSRMFPIFGDLPPPRYVPSGLQRVAPDGAVSYLTPEPMQMPNDLCGRARRHGVLHRSPVAVPDRRRASFGALAWRLTGRVRVVADGFWDRTASASTSTARRSSSSRTADGDHHGFVRCSTERQQGTVRARARRRRVRGRRRRPHLHGRRSATSVTVYERDGTVVELTGSRPGDHPVAHELLLRRRRPAHAVRRSTPARPGHVYCWTVMPTPGPRAPPLAGPRRI